jgi:hypothetical protein
MISGQDWSDSATWLGLVLALVIFGFALYAVFF